MLDTVTGVLSLPGFIIGTLVFAACAWYLGLHQPLLLTGASLLIGGGGGALLEQHLFRRILYRRQGK